MNIPRSGIIIAKKNKNQLFNTICPKCGKSFTTAEPYIICRKFHSVCYKCSKKLKRCPICNKSILHTPIRNIFIREYAEYIKTESKDKKSVLYTPIRNIFISEYAEYMKSESYDTFNTYELVDLINVFSDQENNTDNILAYINKNAEMINPNTLCPAASGKTPLMKILDINDAFAAKLIIKYISVFEDKIDPNFKDLNGEPTTAYIITMFWSFENISVKNRIKIANQYFTAFHSKISLAWDSYHHDLLMLNKFNRRPKRLIAAFIKNLNMINNFDPNENYPWSKLYPDRPMIYVLIRGFENKTIESGITSLFRIMVSKFAEQITDKSFNTQIDLFELSLLRSSGMDINSIKFLFNTFIDLVDINKILFNLICCHPKLARYLMRKYKNKIDINTLNNKGDTLFTYAIKLNRKTVNTEILLFKDKIDINRRFPPDDYTPIILACNYSIPTLRTLITEFKQDINASIHKKTNPKINNILKHKTSTFKNQAVAELSRI